MAKRNAGSRDPLRGVQERHAGPFPLAGPGRRRSPPANPTSGAPPRYDTARTTSTTTAIARATAPTYTNSRNASASERNGLSNGRPLEDVDRHEDDDPHDVDEVPVDPRHLDAAVLVGREVAPEG